MTTSSGSAEERRQQELGPRSQTLVVTTAQLEPVVSEANRAEARKIMEELGYTKDNPLKIKVSTRNIAIYRDPAVILIDQLKAINVEAELEVIETEL